MQRSTHEEGRYQSCCSRRIKASYGDDDKHAGVDAALCARVIEHSHSFCNHLIEQDDALSGAIGDLSTESAVVQPDIEQDINADMDPFPGAEEEQDEEV